MRRALEALRLAFIQPSLRFAIQGMDCWDPYWNFLPRLPRRVMLLQADRRFSSPASVEKQIKRLAKRVSPASAVIMLGCFLCPPNVLAIKIAPFNRYQTLDVVRAVADAGRANGIALYTGNDDNIVIDLLTTYCVPMAAGEERLNIVGGLLGHWACWTKQAVELLMTCKRARNKENIPAHLLTLAVQITDCNAAIFDAANGFAGCISGIHEVLRRQGLMQSTVCLDPHATLSPGQRDEIDRVCRVYPHLTEGAT